jgi:hypothetical protein
MGFVFVVDEVERASEALPARRLADTVGDALALGADAELQVVDHGGTHPLLGAVHLAFAGHRPLVLSPDAVWLTIAQGVAQHVRLHAEELRPRLVRHPGTKTLEVAWQGPMPTDAASWSTIVASFRDRVAGEIGEGRARLLECDFSTTTDAERVASRVVLMDVYAPYFDYGLVCVCGIPEVTLLGTPDDWRKIRERIDVVAELDAGTWTRSLAPICDELARAAAGSPDVAFWQRMYKPRDAYGGEVITGWIARLYPYLQSGGKVGRPNPLLELPLDQPSGAGGPRGMYTGPGVRGENVPAGPSAARVTVVDHVRGERCEVALEGGVLAVAQDAEGRLAPVCGWVLRRSRAAIAVVAERIRAAHTYVPARSHAAREGEFMRDPSGPADFVGLFHELEEATLFAPARPWRIRPPAEHERVEFAGRLGREIVDRFLDLPDGTFVGLAYAKASHLYVRARIDALETLPPSDRPRVADVRSRQRVEEVHVLRGRLAEILSAVLDGDGAPELAEAGSFDDALP